MERAEEQKPDSWMQSLMDSDGLPWSSRLTWGWLAGWIGAVLFLLGPLVGIYLGLWLRTKERSAFVLFLYSALAVFWYGLFLIPYSPHSRYNVIGISYLGITVVLWFAAAFMLRSEVMRHYESCEGMPFKLNLFLTAIFSAWYVSGQLRVEFPLGETGTVGTGVLKLVD